MAKWRKLFRHFAYCSHAGSCGCGRKRVKFEISGNNFFISAKEDFSFWVKSRNKVVMANVKTANLDNFGFEIRISVTILIKNLKNEKNV
jgi:hypothetical protein